MDATIIEKELLNTVEKIGTLSQEVARAHTTWKGAEYEWERQEALAFTLLKAKHEHATLKELQTLVMEYPTVHDARMKHLISESHYRNLSGQLEYLKTRVDIFRSLLGMERAKVEAAIELGDYNVSGH